MNIAFGDDERPTSLSFSFLRKLYVLRNTSYEGYDDQDNYPIWQWARTQSLEPYEHGSRWYSFTHNITIPDACTMPDTEYQEQRSFNRSSNQANSTGNVAYPRPGSESHFLPFHSVHPHAHGTHDV